MKLLALLLCLIPAQNLYVQPVEVCEVNTDLITTIDNNGNLWQFYGDGFEELDNLYLVLDSNGTEEVWDDVIVGVSE